MHKSQDQYPFSLTMSPSGNDSLCNEDPPSMQPVISEYHFILTESSGSKKMADSLSCTGNVQDESQLTCARQQGAIKNNELVPKGHRSQTKKPLTALG